MTEQRRWGCRTAVGLLAVVALGGCSGTSAPRGAATGTGATTTAAGAGGTSSATGAVDARAVDARATARTEEVMAMGPVERDAALAAAGVDLELAVAAESGLASALGGREAARAALTAAWAPVVGRAASLKANVVTFAWHPGAPDVPALGEGFFGGYLVAALGADAAVSATSGLKAGPPVTETKDGVTVTGAQNRGELTVDATYLDNATGVTTKLLAKTGVVPCPDVDGRFEAEANVDVTVSKGDVGQHGTLDVKVVGTVDDLAHLAGSDLTYTMEWSRTSGGSTQLVNVAGGRSSTGPTAGKVTRTGGASTADLEASATVGGQMYAALIEHSLLDAARKGWESGRCVHLDVTTDPGPDSVRPGGTANITAAPRSSIDGGKVGGTVVATLTGQRSLDPNGTPVPADASYVYTAPTDGLPTTGRVAFEARSRRGVAKADVAFQIFRIGYVASGTGENITFSGTTDDPELFFTLSGDFVGGSATFDFSADRTDDGDVLNTGVVTITGGGSDAKVTGGGTYVLVANADGTRTVTMKTHACVDVSGACRDSTDVITLTPKGP